jgi:hypothetical protein
LREGLIAEIESKGFPVLEVPDAAAIGGANSLTDFATNMVSIRVDVEDASQVRTLAHELGHLLLHNPQHADWGQHRGIGEVEAESFALMISAAHGMDASGYTIPYVASWAASVPGKTPVEVVQATADRVCRTACEVLARLDTPQAGNGTPGGLHGADRDITEDHDSAVPAAAGVARIADSVPVGGEGRRSEEATRGWLVGGDARLVDIGTGLRETVTVAAVHDDETVTVPADGLIWPRPGADRVSSVPDCRPTREVLVCAG